MVSRAVDSKVGYFHWNVSVVGMSGHHDAGSWGQVHVIGLESPVV